MARWNAGNVREMKQPHVGREARARQGASEEPPEQPWSAVRRHRREQRRMARWNAGNVRLFR
jgi:hypothetical protein